MARRKPAPAAPASEATQQTPQPTGPQLTGPQRKAARQVRIAEKKRLALEMRAQGKSYQEIADALGYADRSGPWELVQTALREMVQEPADIVRQLELERLDRALEALWPQVQRGDVLAIDRLIKIMDRRSRYLGLDAPTKQVLAGDEEAPVQVKANVTTEEDPDRAARILAILAEIGVIPAGADRPNAAQADEVHPP